MPGSPSDVEDNLNFAQIQHLALSTTKLVYDVISPSALTRSYLLKGTSFEDKTLTIEDRVQLIAEFSRKLIKINPNCTTAIRYLARVIEEGATILPQDLLGTKFAGSLGPVDKAALAAELYSNAEKDFCKTSHAEEDLSRQYLEVEYRQQDRRFRRSQNLVALALYVSEEANQIKKPMLLGSQWEHVDPMTVDRHKLMVELFSTATKVEPMNIMPMYLLRRSTQKSTKKKTGEADFSAAAIDSTVAVGLCRQV